MHELLKATDLSMVFHNGENKTVAVNHVDLEISKGEFVSMIGTSGSGKTTLLNLLAGLEKPTEGTVYINGVDIYKQKKDDRTIFRRQNTGFIFQNFNLIPVLNVWENIILPVSLDKKSLDEDYMNRMIRLLGMEHKLHQFPDTLSGGQQQRVAIARALANKPQLLFADEPTGNLDKTTSNDVVELLKKIWSEFNQTIIMVTHDPYIEKNYGQNDFN